MNHNQSFPYLKWGGMIVIFGSLILMSNLWLKSSLEEPAANPAVSNHPRNEMIATAAPLPSSSPNLNASVNSSDEKLIAIPDAAEPVDKEILYELPTQDKFLVQ